jgi:hypothetical protein
MTLIAGRRTVRHIGNGVLPNSAGTRKASGSRRHFRGSISTIRARGRTAYRTSISWYRSFFRYGVQDFVISVQDAFLVQSRAWGVGERSSLSKAGNCLLRITTNITRRRPHHPIGG